ncbi:protein lin-28 homolog isoform X1 [Tribolium castaneum]|uniref:Protein lin-28 homolog-like Protein n=1 Tax=Tribolium castaneum TaxID=7070 RepID=D6WJ86_TRICA|nr:PREDICTED: protein lin-28 homolog isoform X1 [Tribolium castaneum]EFA04440.2 Protein lin-28 homolog-like Protein [Tribolium castaneum]|eukprot:XP_975245.1 PREDICTED: protein lin-28 homolog isoform X1 [Tribolium castaneum]
MTVVTADEDSGVEMSHPRADNGSEGGSASQGGSEASFGLRRGKCKWFNVAKGWGFITPDDGGQDVFVHQSVIQMSGFRSLGDDEEVEFECQVSDKGLEATKVSGPQNTDCRGSHRRPASKKRFRKIRCYNCGEFANHIAAKCTMGPQPKRCHNCKSEDHLIADCPTRVERPKKPEKSEHNGNEDTAASSEETKPE